MQHRTDPTPRAAVADVPMTDGLAALVMAVLALPAVAGESFAGLAELVSIPSRVLDTVAAEITEARDRREMRTRPSCEVVRAMALAALDAQRGLTAVRAAMKSTHR
jgi:hypothetical protein